MSGMEPMLVGAMLGGGVSAARGDNPLKGALLGGISGGIFSGASSLAASKLAAAAPTGTTGAMAGAGGSGMFTAGTQAVNPNTYFAAGTPVASTGNALMPQGAITVATPTMYAPTLMQTVKEIPNSLQVFSKENPFQMNLASNIMLQDAQRDAQRLAEMRARSGLISGKQIQEMPQGSSFAVPQFSLI